MGWTDEKGATVEFVPEDAAAAAISGERRPMDCTDCHNRAGHAFQTPERAVDGAIAAGRISSALPSVRQQAVAALKASYPDQAAALRGIESSLDEAYKTKYPDAYRDAPAIRAAIETTEALYARHVFPPMNVGWGTFPNNIGHTDSPGCFRCHDGSHKSADGRVITQECDACHTVAAMEEENPKILTDLASRRSEINPRSRRRIAHRSSGLIHRKAIAATAPPSRSAARDSHSRCHGSMPMIMARRHRRIEGAAGDIADGECSRQDGESMASPK